MKAFPYVLSGIKSGIKIVPLFLSVFVLIACQRYSFSINDKTIYTPKPLFSAYNTADSHLHRCLAETIAEQRLTQAEQLEKLLCPAGEIRDLSGLEIFVQLKHLGLGNNQIQDIAPLGALKKLEQIDLSGNDISSFSALQDLVALRVLKAEKNNRANCAELNKIAAKGKVIFPSHCTGTINPTHLTLNTEHPARGGLT